MSAYRAKEMSTKMSAAGITGFLAKPFRGNDVLDLVAKYLKNADVAAKGGDVGAVV
jgi:FixJ family two-component response regulator